MNELSKCTVTVDLISLMTTCVAPVNETPLQLRNSRPNPHSTKSSFVHGHSNLQTRWRMKSGSKWSIGMDRAQTAYNMIQMKLNISFYYISLQLQISLK